MSRYQNLQQKSAKNSIISMPFPGFFILQLLCLNLGALRRGPFDATAELLTEIFDLLAKGSKAFRIYSR